MKSLNPFLILLACWLFSPAVVQAQKVEGMEGEMKGGRQSESRNNDSDGEFWLFLVDFFFQVGFYPTYGLLFGFENEIPANEFGYNSYPWADGQSGLYLPLDEQGRRTMAQATMHLQSNEDAVYGAYMQIRFSPDRFVTLDLNRLQLIEDSEDNGTDWLSFNNLNVQFTRVRKPRFQLWWGTGLMLVDGSETHVSPSLSGGFTWYFRKPLALHAESQIGWPGGAFSRQNQVRMQVHLNRFMVYAGYQGTKVGSVGVPNWALGTGVWF